ncbi:MAG: rhodanese-like domain-containing protein [Vicingaceae bacterium]
MFVEINALDLKKRLATEKKPFILDVREAYEFEDGSIADVNIPMAEVLKRINELKKHREIVVCCQTGKRSRAVAYHLSKNLEQAKVFTLNGGLESLNL